MEGVADAQGGADGVQVWFVPLGRRKLPLEKSICCYTTRGLDHWSMSIQTLIMMKYKNFILCVALIALTAAGCRKGNSGSPALRPAGRPVPPLPPAGKPPSKVATVSTFAGDGTSAYLDGPLLSAKFNTPIDIAISADGTLYVADYNDRRIRRITGGQVSVLAGDGNFGTRDGAGDTAQFVDPFRIEVDPNGKVFIDDTNNGCIRKINAAGQVQTFAGREAKGFVDGDTSVAEFHRRGDVGND